MNDLEKAIVKTIAWFDIFDYPLTSWELWRYLWAPPADRRRDGANAPTQIDADATYEKIHHTLENPSDWLSQRIESQGAWHFLRGKSWLIERRHKQHVLFVPRWKRAHKMAQRASMIPFLHTFAMCNTFALENAKRESDLDVFVITHSKRLWTARSLLWLLTFLLGKWRHKQKIANRFCLSFFVSHSLLTKGRGGEGSNLNLSKIAEQPYDPYLVYWIALLAPLYDTGSIKDFFTANSWIKDYLPNWFPREESGLYVVRGLWLKENIKKLFETILSGRLGDLTEKLAKSLQYRYMHPETNKYPPGSVIVSDTMLKFHNEDRREHFRRIWENNTNALLSS